MAMVMAVAVAMVTVMEMVLKSDHSDRYTSSTSSNTDNVIGFWIWINPFLGMGVIQQCRVIFVER